MKSLMKKTKMALAMAAALPAMAVVAPSTAQAETAMSGNVGVFSKYVFRGLQQGGGENAGASVQGGFDLEHGSGLYAGYWGSNLGYADEVGETGFENDVYVGYAGSAGGLSYGAGVTYYKYLSVADADTPEVFASVGYGPVTLGLAYLASDVAWGNTGDIYWSLDFETDLPKDFALSARVGYYTYEESGDFIATSELTSGFRHLDVTLSHPIGKTGADMSITGIYGGVDRDDVDQGSTVVMGVAYGFDI